MAVPLAAVPTHLIAGPLGAGKTSLIQNLLDQRPAGERWAVLVNEFGQIGLDAALLARDEAGVTLAEIAGGCLCCVNGVPFQVCLARLLRQARPQRLLIEPSGLGHPADLLRQLTQAPWDGVLSVQPAVMVLDAAALARGEALPDVQRAALATAGLLVLNKAEGLDAEACARATRALPARPLRWTEHGRLALADLPSHERPSHERSGGVRPSSDLPDSDLSGPERSGPEWSSVDPLRGERSGLPFSTPGSAPLPTLWQDPSRPLCQVQDAPEGWSIGWRWHPQVRFDRGRLAAWLGTLSWRRAKLVVREADGWWSANALDGAALAWRPSEWRRDSRLELIFTRPQDASALTAGLEAARDAAVEPMTTPADGA
ncbi:CobW family GTP-binding protein [Pseudomonas mangiferae]|uniref:GTP-binding protein n=1 Tax=Pseudomonas mangiferae TaxID=2593654 RepID=A0A553GW83_9PSED|nr:CobW family GTP-binding protein [Pseudomonas mangiferae]TRX73770.1 GTP-binding protein [Pseudomonas mangiferae]